MGLPRATTALFLLCVQFTRAQQGISATAVPSMVSKPIETSHKCLLNDYADEFRFSGFAWIPKG
jgi:hypothetical protein